MIREFKRLWKSLTGYESSYIYGDSVIKFRHRLFIRPEITHEKMVIYKWQNSYEPCKKEED